LGPDRDGGDADRLAQLKATFVSCGPGDRRQDRRAFRLASMLVIRALGSTKYSDGHPSRSARCPQSDATSSTAGSNWQAVGDPAGWQAAGTDERDTGQNARRLHPRHFLDEAEGTRERVQQPCSAINSFKSCDRCPFVPDTRPPRSAARRAKVIGVVRDTGTRGLSPDDVLARQPSQFYRSYTQAGLVPATVIART
jgi:hypothetical protein